MIFVCLYVWVLYWWNYLMSGFMVCANSGYLRYICDGNLGVLSYNM